MAITERHPGASQDCSLTGNPLPRGLLRQNEHPSSECSSSRVPYRFANPAERSARSADRPRSGNPAGGRPRQPRASRREPGEPGACEDMPGEPVPPRCHAFPVPVEPSPAPRHIPRAAVPREHTAPTAGLPFAGQGRQRRTPGKSRNRVRVQAGDAPAAGPRRHGGERLRSPTASVRARAAAGRGQNRRKSAPGYIARPRQGQERSTPGTPDLP